MALLRRTYGSMPWRSAALALLSGAGMPGCGEGLVDDSYEGEVVESFAYSVEGDHPEGGRLAVFWWKALEGAEGVDEMQEDTSSGVLLSAKDVAGELKLFNAPPDAVLHEVDGTGGKRLAVGSMLAYVDTDGSGTLSAGEEQTGKVIRRFILYAPQRIPPQEGLNAAPIPKGFHIVHGPIVCEGLPPTGSDCDVPFGKACYGDEHCGAGTCMEQTDVTWPSGMCVQLSHLSECVPDPEYARAVRLPPNGLLYGQSCQSDEDCARLGRYGCEPMAGICLPDQPMPVYFGPEAVIRAELCGRVPGMGGGRPRPPGDGGSGTRPPGDGGTGTRPPRGGGAP